MVELVTWVGLPIDEKLMIKKNRLMPDVTENIKIIKTDGEEDSESQRQADMEQSRLKRISIVTGIHGDELEGQYVCYELQRRINLERHNLKGIVDIYPAMNPLGVDSITRGIPAFDLDMNRLFPGNKDGNMTEYLAAGIMNDVMGSDLVLDIHASNIYLTEIPQIRINELHKDFLLPMAELSNVDFIWVHGASTVLKATFAHSLNSVGTPVLVCEMGVGMRLTREYGDQLVNGIFNLMKELGIWKGQVEKVRRPIISQNPEDVIYLNASASGLFVPEVKHGTILNRGDLIGRIVNPLDGRVLDEVKAPDEGMLFTIRDYPIVDEGSLMGRILKREVLGL
ncbi:MAG: succinylglutamate desuccinylase/aspartoacylase family protein [Eubacterium sp.]|nr:succinylglutamate desuccinylase/aspartoacylase family protein [Eubacterium sp.]